MASDHHSRVNYTRERSPGQALAAFTENYAGNWDSERDYAAAWADVPHAADGTPVPEPFASYFDAAAYARDLFRSGMFSITLPHGNIAAFRSH